jgi:hypothetical protein
VHKKQRSMTTNSIPWQQRTALLAMLPHDLPHISDHLTAIKNEKVFEILDKVLSTCTVSTLYDMNPPDPSRHLTVITLILEMILTYAHWSPSSDGTPIPMLLDELQRIYQQRAMREITLPAHLLCPWITLTHGYNGYSTGIYDINGMAWLCWQTLHHIKGCQPSIQLDALVAETQQSNPCRRKTARSFTCSPIDAVAFETMEQCLSPEGAATLRDYISMTKWDLNREHTIANVLRSVHQGGLTTVAITTSTFCMASSSTTPQVNVATLAAATSGGGGSGASGITSESVKDNNNHAVITNTKPKRTKPQRKATDTRHAKIIAAASDSNINNNDSTEPINPELQESEESLASRSKVTTAEAQLAAPPESNVSVMSDRLDATLHTASRMLHESMKADATRTDIEHINETAVQAFDRLNYTANTAANPSDILSSTTINHATTGTAAAAATNTNTTTTSSSSSSSSSTGSKSTQPSVIPLTGILRAPPKRGVVTGAPRKEDAFGDPDFDSTRYVLCKPRSELGDNPTAMHNSNSDYAFESVHNFLVHILKVSPMLTTAALRNQWLKIPWADFTFGSANELLGPYELAHPCACIAELVALLSNLTFKHLIDSHTSKLRNLSPMGFDNRHLQAIDPKLCDRVLASLAIDIACGTVPDMLKNSVELSHIMHLDRELLSLKFPIAIARTYDTLTRPLQWVPCVPSAARLHVPMVPFSDPPPPPPSSTTTLPIKRVQSTTTRLDNDRQYTDRIPGLVRMWTHLMSSHRDALARDPVAVLHHQDWSFIPITPCTSAIRAIAPVYQSGDVIRAWEMIASTTYLNTFDPIMSNDVGQMVDVEALCVAETEAPACDVCHTWALSYRALQTRICAVGVPVVHLAPVGTQTTILLPRRQAALVKGTTPLQFAALDGVVMGSMMMLMNPLPQCPPSHILGCDTIAPFVFGVLAGAAHAQQIEGQHDKEREIYIANHSGIAHTKNICHRLGSYDPLIRAALCFVSDTAQVILKAAAHTTPYTTNTDTALCEPLTTIPSMRMDQGAISADYVQPRRGWFRQQIAMPQWDTRQLYTRLGQFLCAYVAAGLPLSPLALRGIVCLVRPMRLWLVSRTALTNLLAVIPNEKEKGNDSDGDGDNNGVTCLRVMLQGEPTTTHPLPECMYMATKANINDDSLTTRTTINTTLGNALADFVMTAPAQVQAVLESLCLAKYSAVTTNLVEPDVPASESCADGSYGALPPNGFTMERPHVYNEYNEDLDGFVIPSQPLLAQSMIAVITKLTASTTPAALDPLLQLLCQPVLPLAVEVGSKLTVTQLMQSVESSAPPFSPTCKYIPLAYRSCTQTYLLPWQYIPIADNPMSLARSRLVQCNGCNQVANNTDPLMRVVGTTMYDRALLPKTSPLLSQLMHYRNGLTVVPHAWPDQTASTPTTTTTTTSSTTTSTSTPAPIQANPITQPHKYAAAVAKYLATFTPEGVAVTQHMATTTMAMQVDEPAPLSRRDDDNHMDEDAGFSMDPNVFEAMMMAEQAELQRARLKSTSLPKH